MYRQPWLSLVLVLAGLPGTTSWLGAEVAFSLSHAQVTPDAAYNRTDFALPWPHISLQEAKRLHGMPGVLFVDGRSYPEWEKSRIPGALALPAGEFDKRYAMNRAKIRRARIIVIYCHGENCGLADTLAQLLTDKGHRDVAVFWGGFPAWKTAKLPLEGGKPRG